MSYIFFWKSREENGWFGNWYASPFTIDDINYSCVEQYLMRRKAIFFNDDNIAQKIMKTEDPKKHKSYGRKVKNFNEITWDQHKEQILYDGIYAKFSQNLVLKEKLLTTGDKILAEASPYDKIYGIGRKCDDPRALDEKKWLGQNLLGITLMKVRNDLM